MNVLMIEVIGISLYLFDEVVIFGHLLDTYQSVSDLISNINTIEYEMLCAHGRRVKRIYK